MSQRRQRRPRRSVMSELHEWRSPPLWERLVALLGLLLILALLGYLLGEAIWGDESLPDVEIVVEKIQHNGQDHVVSFVAKNNGGMTAAGVTVRGRLIRDGEVLEEAEVTIDFIPSESSRRGGLFFVNNPASNQLLIGASGYSDP